MKSTLETQRLQKISEEVKEKLLSSLWYEEMNQRQAELDPPQEDTVQWIFEDWTPTYGSPLSLQMSNSSHSYFSRSNSTGSDNSRADSTFSSISRASSFSRASTVVGDTPEVLDEPTTCSPCLQQIGEPEVLSKFTLADIAENTKSGETMYEPRIHSFRKWLESGDDVYWISGKPGSGKSTLFKFVVEDHVTRTALESWRPSILILKHFFLEAGTEKQRTLKGCLCSLLYQILKQSNTCNDLLRADTDMFDKVSYYDWCASYLKATLLKTLSLEDAPQAVCIFLDGLDEIVQTEQEALLELIDSLKIISNIKLCVSSRPENIFQDHFSEGSMLRVQDLTRKGIAAYVRSTLSPLQNSPGMCSQSWESFIGEILDRAEGVFLWVVLVTRSLQKGSRNCDDMSHCASGSKIYPKDFTLYIGRCGIDSSRTNLSTDHKQLQSSGLP